MHKCNIDYFKIIDTEEKAYWLGFLYADGCVTQNYKSLRINLSPIDYHHLEKFNQCIQSDYNIKYKDNNRYASLIISNKKFVENLVNKGCIPKKSLVLSFPNNNILPKNLRKDFIRGYFDGDGCFSAIMRNRKNKPNPVFEGEINVLGTYDILKHIVLEFPTNIVPIKQFGKIYKIRYQSKQSIFSILSYLYNNSTIYLDRKFNKYIENMDNFIDKRKVKNNIPVTTTVI